MARPGPLAFLAALAVPAIWLRFRMAGAHLPWLDEIGLWLQSVSAYDNSADGPLTIVVTRAALLLHDNWSALHWAPAFLGGLACVPVGLLAARVSGEQRVGVAAALLYGLAPMSVFLSGQARPYGMLLFFEALALCAFAEAIAADRVRPWIGFGLASILMVNIHLLGLVVLAGLATGMGLSWARGPSRPTRTTLVGLGLSSLAALLSIPPRLLARAKPGPDISGLPPRMLDWLGEGLAAWIAPVSAATPNWPVALVSLGLLALGGFVAWRRRNTLLLCLVSVGVLAQCVTALTIGHKALWTMAERYVSHGLVPFLVVGAWLLASREVAVFVTLRRLAGAAWLLYSAACLPQLFTRRTPHDVEQRALLAAHEALRAMQPPPMGIVLESYRALAHFRLLAPSPVPVWLRQRERLQRVEYSWGLAGPPAVPRLRAAQMPPGAYLLVGRLSQPQGDCPTLAAQMGREGRSRRARVGVLCVLGEPAP